MRKVVVLPAPFGPRKPTISPSDTVRSTPRTASTVRLRLVNVRASPRASMIAMRVSSPFAGRACLFSCLAAAVLIGRQSGQDLGEFVVPAHLGLRVQLAAVHDRRLERVQPALGHPPLPVVPTPRHH